MCRLAAAKVIHGFFPASVEQAPSGLFRIRDLGGVLLVLEAFRLSPLAEEAEALLTDVVLTSDEFPEECYRQFRNRFEALFEEAERLRAAGIE